MTGAPRSNNSEKVKQRYMAYLKTFGTPEGKTVLHDMMKAGHMLQISHVKGDPYETALREGERNAVLRILQILKTDVSKLEQFLKEQENQE